MICLIVSNNQGTHFSFNKSDESFLLKSIQCGDLNLVLQVHSGHSLSYSKESKKLILDGHIYFLVDDK